MKILIGCNKSRREAIELEKLGHAVATCDIEPAEQPGWHIQDDVRNHLTAGWDMAIFEPPCTYMANSGVRWLHTEPGRWFKMLDACNFFNELLAAPIKHIAIENPLPHWYARQLIPPYNMAVQPYWFGDGETKLTCFWLKNLPPLMATQPVQGRHARVHLMPPGPDRQAERSRTPLGLARALAKQYGDFITSH